MNTTRITDRDAAGLAHGRVPSRPDLDPVADLLAEYRSAAIGSAPRPSAALTARLDLAAAPIAMQGELAADSGSTGTGARRAASGLLGLGATVTIILAAASGAAAVVGAGTAGMLPPGAQNAFDQVVSIFVPPGVAGTEETTEPGEAPVDSSVTSPAPQTSGSPSDTENEGKAEDAKPGKGDDLKPGKGEDAKPSNGNANGEVNGDGNANQNSNGNGNSENAGTGKPESNPGNGKPESNPGQGDNGHGNQGTEHPGNGNQGTGDKGNNGKNGDKGKDAAP